MRWITTNMYSTDKLTGLSSHDEDVNTFWFQQAPIFYSYIIIPATINHNNVYTITNDYI